jgi:NADH dehydrogenase
MSKKVVIIGSGFGGIYTYLRLKSFIQEEGLEINIISKNNYFLFTPLLHEVATGSLNPHNVLQPVRNIVNIDANFIEATATLIDFESKKIHLGDKTHPIEYDFLVIATGAKTNFYGTKINDSEIFELKDLNDAVSIRNHIIENFEKAVKETNSNVRKELLNFSVIGAGGTGVEFLTELHDYIFDALYPKYSMSIDKGDIKLNIINKAPKILDRFDEKIASYAAESLENLINVEVMNGYDIDEINNNVIYLSHDNKKLKIHSKNIYWLAGVKPIVPEVKGGMEILPSGRIKIDKALNLNAHPQVFAIGDCAGEYPMLAQIAVKQAELVAKNILNTLRKEPLVDFDYKVRASLISLGRNKAAANIFGLFFTGWCAWFIWRTIYLFKFISWGKRLKIAVDWTVGLLSSRDISKI